MAGTRFRNSIDTRQEGSAFRFWYHWEAVPNPDAISTVSGSSRSTASTTTNRSAPLLRPR